MSKNAYVRLQIAKLRNQFGPVIMSSGAAAAAGTNSLLLDVFGVKQDADDRRFRRTLPEVMERFVGGQAWANVFIDGQFIRLGLFRNDRYYRGCITLAAVGGFYKVLDPSKLSPSRWVVETHYLKGEWQVPNYEVPEGIADLYPRWDKPTGQPTAGIALTNAGNVPCVMWFNKDSKLAVRGLAKAFPGEGSETLIATEGTPNKVSFKLPFERRGVPDLEVYRRKLSGQAVDADGYAEWCVAMKGHLIEAFPEPSKRPRRKLWFCAECAGFQSDNTVWWYHPQLLNKRDHVLSDNISLGEAELEEEKRLQAEFEAESETDSKGADVLPLQQSETGNGTGESTTASA